MMQKVLNDVLDLQRMDSGRFESSASPFPFHRTLQSMLGTLKVATAAKNLGLNIELDERIDNCGAVGDPQGLWVIGDSMRLRQVNHFGFCVQPHVAEHCFSRCCPILCRMQCKQLRFLSYPVYPLSLRAQQQVYARGKRLCIVCVKQGLEPQSV
jgi:hypothetical protein